MNPFFSPLRFLLLLPVALTAFSGQAEETLKTKLFSSLPVKEMRLYVHLAEAMENGYILEDNGGFFGTDKHGHGSYVHGSYIQNAWDYNSSVWSVQNPFSPTGHSTSIVFHGTNGIRDYMMDALTGLSSYQMILKKLGILSPLTPTIPVPQLQAAANHITPLLDTYGGSDPNNPPYITGHSLGGGLAQAAYLKRGAKHRNARLFVVNPMGLPKVRLDTMQISGTYDPNVTIIVNGSEIVQYLNDMAFLNYLGGNRYLLPPSCFSDSEHSIVATVNKMRLILISKEMVLKTCSEFKDEAKEMDAVTYITKVYLPAWLQVNNTLIHITDEESAHSHLDELQENVHRLHSAMQHINSGTVKAAEQQGIEERNAQMLLFGAMQQYGRQRSRLKINNFYNTPEIEAIVRVLE